MKSTFSNSNMVAELMHSSQDLKSDKSILQMSDLLDAEYEKLKLKSGFNKGDFNYLQNQKMREEKLNNKKLKADKNGKPPSNFSFIKQKRNGDEKSSNPISVEEIQLINRQNIINGNFHNSKLPKIATVQNIQELLNGTLKTVENSSRENGITRRKESNERSRENIIRNKLSPSSKAKEFTETPTFDYNPYSRNIKDHKKDNQNKQSKELKIFNNQEITETKSSNIQIDMNNDKTKETNSSLSKESSEFADLINFNKGDNFPTDVIEKSSLKEDNCTNGKQELNIGELKTTRSIQLVRMYKLEKRLLEEKEKLLDKKEQELKKKEKRVRDKEVDYTKKLMKNNQFEASQIITSLPNPNNLYLKGSGSNHKSQNVLQTGYNYTYLPKSMPIPKQRIIETVEPEQINKEESPLSITEYYIDDSDSPFSELDNHYDSKPQLTIANSTSRHMKLQMENEKLLEQNIMLSKQLDSLSDSNIQTLIKDSGKLQNSKLLFQTIELKKIIASLNKEIVELKIKENI